MKETKKATTAKVEKKPAVAKKAAPKATKPAVKTAAKKPATKTASKPAKVATKPAVKTAAKKPATKTAAKPAKAAKATKPAVKKEVKPAVKKEVKAEVKPAAKKPAAAKTAQKKTAVSRAEEDKKAIKNRINRVIGQLNGIVSMVDEGRACEDILIQLVSSYKSVKSISNMLIETEMKDSIKKGAETNNPKLFDEAMEIFRRYQ